MKQSGWKLGFCCLGPQVTSALRALQKDRAVPTPARSPSPSAQLRPCGTGTFEVVRLKQASLPLWGTQLPSKASRRWNLCRPGIPDVGMRLMDVIGLLSLFLQSLKLPLFGNQETHFLWQKKISLPTRILPVPFSDFLLTFLHDTVLSV